MSAQPQSAKPLAGKRILVTRAAHQARQLTSLLDEQGASVAEIPVIEIDPPKSYRPLDNALIAIGSYRWLILTSVNGVEAMFARMAALGLGVEKLAHLQICAIGPATRAALQSQGLKTTVMPRRYVAEAVVEALRDQVRGSRVLLVRATVARDVIPAQLRKAGARVDVVEAYETKVPAGAAERLRSALLHVDQRPHAITFTSSSTALNLIEILGGASDAQRLLAGIALASIGPITSATLREAGLEPTVEAAQYTMAGLAEALVKSAALV
jgi:uroporphyrinogen-III synthase